MNSAMINAFWKAVDLDCHRSMLALIWDAFIHTDTSTVALKGALEIQEVDQKL